MGSQRVACFMPLTASWSLHLTASWSRGRGRSVTNCLVVSRRPTPAQGEAARPLQVYHHLWKRKHYEDECYHKQRLSANLKTDNASGKGGKGGKGRHFADWLLNDGVQI